MLHTLGYGFGYRQGKHLTGYKKLIFEGEFVSMKDPKEIKILNPIGPNSKSFIYGKLNYLFILRAGAGVQKVINSKPYWGGVEIRYFYYGGASICLTKPVYLFYKINYPVSPDAQGSYSPERYDPNKDDNNIYGRAPFTYGLNKMNIHPGIYGKFGFNFEFGQEDTKIRCLEVGVTADAYPKPIPVMAFNPDKSIFLSAYLSYSFGRRLNK